MGNCVVCGKDSGKGKTCGPTCRQRLRRSVTTTVTESKCDKPTVTPEQCVPTYEIVEGQTVYGRQAVRYNLQEKWELRPEPESPNDIPKLHNRGVYTRFSDGELTELDGSEYQIDAVGGIHEVDFAGRRKDKEVLDQWADGKGTEHQQLCGILSQQYTKVNKIKANSYLGAAQ